MFAKSLTVSALAAAVFAADEADRVTSIPDMAVFDTYPVYSGYLTVDADKQLHYMLVESQADPVNDPLIIWFNGGPGCSSMLGFAQEHGPYMMVSGTDYWQINPWSWNQNANMLYIESPAGVGYSTCDNLSTCNNYTDPGVAADNLAAVQSFFAKFPEFRANDLWVSGESYAGMYVPYLANEIYEYNLTGPANPINMKGFMVGNGVTNYTYDCTPAYVDMGYWHSLYSTELYDEIKANNCDFGLFASRDATCNNLLQQFNALVADVNVYDIFGVCWGLGPYPQMYESNVTRGYTSADYTPFLYENNGAPVNSSLPPCTFGTPIESYFNRADVRASMHIPTTVQEWKLCTTKINIEYQRDQGGSQWVYEKLAGIYRMLHYSGDTDGAVPTWGTQQWIATLGWDVVDSWQAYLVDGQVGGYWESYVGDFTFGTVHGAGHMAPQFKPPQTYYLIFNWLNGTL